MTAQQRIAAFISKPYTHYGLYALLAIAAAIVQYAKGAGWGGNYTFYNNYIIFKQSFYHLLAGQDLYVHYQEEQMDLFKYPPVFALFFGLFAWMPDQLGLIAWNLLNALVLASAIQYIKIFSPKQKAFAMLYIAVELLTSMQSCQSNGLIAGLMIWAYNSFEDKHVGKAALFIALATFIKPFGLVGASLFLLYPDKKKFISGLALWCIILAALPILAAPSGTLINQYKSWFSMLNADHAASMGYSVVGWITAWFGTIPNKLLVTVAGVLIFCTVYINRKAWHTHTFQLLMIASALLWSVIFNHKAESPTFVIAAAGVALWYFSKERSGFDTTLMALVLIFTIFSPTDLFPATIRTNVVIPYQLKVFPCIMVWGKIVWEQLTLCTSYSAEHTKP